jgi:hypothetical protein
MSGTSGIGTTTDVVTRHGPPASHSKPKIRFMVKKSVKTTTPSKNGSILQYFSPLSQSLDKKTATNKRSRVDNKIRVTKKRKTKKAGKGEVGSLVIDVISSDEEEIEDVLLGGQNIASSSTLRALSPNLPSSSTKSRDFGLFFPDSEEEEKEEILATPTGEMEPQDCPRPSTIECSDPEVSYPLNDDIDELINEEILEEEDVASENEDECDVFSFENIQESFRCPVCYNKLGKLSEDVGCSEV